MATPKNTSAGSAVGSGSLRRANVVRQTKETDLTVALALDGGAVDITLNTPGFFVHMLNTLAVYAGWGLSLSGCGDVKVDAHHTVEDVGLVLGEAISLSLGDYTGHARFGWALVPMDEALAEAALDVGRRPYLSLSVDWPQPVTGDFELCLVEEFFRALAQKAGFTLHLIFRHGANSHHICEAIFKAAGLAARQALAVKPGGVFSTKGVL
ncbi:MAG: imidazoleglycerol-phosphate dehydratase [Deltaproteobacteria bacterium]|jgi:imidazoleglycerol-phosphate dehydratase|nr:imidazoleglycerol-phosphate dehydratase [Deltaproteobacteria bacterium]